jgi:DNA-binding CsgD family transcriptional regulator
MCMRPRLPPRVLVFSLFFRGAMGPPVKDGVSQNLAVELALRARDAPDAPAFRREVLDVYRGLIPYDTAVFTEPVRSAPITTVDVDSAAFQLITHCERNFARYEPDLRRPLEVARRVGGFVDHEVYSSRDRRELPIYCEMVKPQRVRSILLLLPAWKGNVLGMIRLERHGARPFSHEDVDAATALLPVVEVGVAALRSTLSPVAEEAMPELSRREAQIAGHVERGLTTFQIALILGTSPLTVRNQIGRIFDKTGVASRAELAAWVTRRRPAP